MSYAIWEREVLPLQRNESDFDVFVKTHEYRISNGLLEVRGPEIDPVTPPILQAFWQWMEETQHPASATQLEYFLDPVIEDAPVVAAAMLEAADEFLAQYNG